ncbi:MAG: hypothetical protein N2C12_16555, partial [Planctomycetales bacterium]
LYPFWPFSKTTKWVYPMVDWGDPGITIVFVIGMFAMACWKTRLALIARLTLCFVLLYIIIGAAIDGRFQ